MRKICMGMVMGIVLFLSATTAGWCQETKVLNIVTTEFCPYVCIAEKEGGRNGFVIDIFTQIFAKQGYTVKYDIQPWTRAIKTFNEEKNFDGLIAATKIHPINKDIAIFPDTEICRYTHKFYGLKDSPLATTWKYKGIESLKDIRLGGIKGWSYSSVEITKYVNETPEPKVYAMFGEDVLRRNIMMLLNKHTDLYVENEFMVDYFLFREKQAGNKDMEKIIPVDSVPIDEGVAESYAVFYKDKNGKKYADILTEGMKELRTSGKLNEIMAVYGLKDWK